MPFLLASVPVVQLAEHDNSNQNHVHGTKKQEVLSGLRTTFYEPEQCRGGEIFANYMRPILYAVVGA
jgi:hypothetical protein